MSLLDPTKLERQLAEAHHREQLEVERLRRALERAQWFLEMDSDWSAEHKEEAALGALGVVVEALRNQHPEPGSNDAPSTGPSPPLIRKENAT